MCLVKHKYFDESDQIIEWYAMVTKWDCNESEKEMYDPRTMDMTIDQQVAMDEALVSYARRLRIGRRNFCLLSYISSKESTLQLVGAIRRLADVNINKLHQPWRSFAAIINKCLTGKSSDYDSLRLSQAQILWGLYHKRNVDFAYLMWEDFVDQVEHKDTKKSNKMYYPRFTKFGAMLPIELTNADIRNSNAYKEYYAVATGATPPKTKASVQKTKSSSDTTVTPSPIAAAGPRLSTSAKGKQPATTSKAKSLTTLSEVVITEAQQLKLATKRSLQQTHISQASSSGAHEGTVMKKVVMMMMKEMMVIMVKKEMMMMMMQKDDVDQEDERDDDDEDDQEEGSDDDQASDKEGNGKDRANVGRKEGHDEEDEEDELYKDVNINQGRGSSSVSSQFVTSMLNPTSQMDVPTPTLMAPLLVSAPTLTPSTIATVTTIQLAPTPSITAPSMLLQDLPNFGLLFRFDHRLKTLKANFSELMQTNQFTRAVSSILGIVQRYMDQRMNEAVKVKEQVKVQVSKILPKIEQTVNKQLEAEVLTRSSNSSKTSYAVATDLSEMELKNILIEKMEGNKYIHRSNEQRNLSKALVEAYESDMIILDTYGDTVTLKRRRDDDADKDKEPFRLIRPRGSCKSLVELKFFLEEVYKATTDQLDWVNPKGQQYLNNLLKPLPLIPKSRGHRVIPFNHFINNNLEYLYGGVSSCKYTTSVTKTKAADYRNIKRQHFYDFAVNQEFARDVYSKRRIIAVIELKIVEWHNYKNLDWITLANLTVEERFAFNVSLRMFTRSIVIQRRMEDLQLSVKSYQKKLNLTRPDTDGTLTDVRTALDDRLKGIQMKYLPQSI
nr:hypothetical protein [Tanacetum cinerariifolium]